MKDSRIVESLRVQRRARELSQAALAERSGVSRVAIARLEAGAARDVRLGTLERLCAALGLSLELLPRGGAAAGETRIARERGRSVRLDRRRRHAALAARLLAMPAAQAAAMVRRARVAVERWERDSLCSEHYISRWRARLAGPPRRAAAALLEHDDWTDALLQNSPWSFALEPPAP